MHISCLYVQETFDTRHQLTTTHLFLLCVSAAFLNMLCSLKWGIYIFFGVWQFIAILFTLFLVPETQGVPIEKVVVQTGICSLDTGSHVPAWQCAAVTSCGGGST